MSVEVTPKGPWMQPNKKGFLDWTYKTFHPDTYESKSKSSDGMFAHQRFVRDFLQYDSPYRGLLLFHQLGTGKTASSIAAAEGFISRDKHVIVMVPASLQMNYKNEIMRYASVGQPQKKQWAMIDLDKAGANGTTALGLSKKFLREQGATAKAKGIVLIFPMAFVPKEFPEDALMKKNISWSHLKDDQQAQAQEVLMYFIEKKYTFINYNGVTSKGDALKTFTKAIGTKNPLVIIDEAHNFISRVVNGAKITVARQMYQHIMDAASARVILLTGTPIINHPFELAMALNLVRGPIEIDVYKVKDKMPASADDVYLALEEAAISDTVDEVILDHRNMLIKVVMKENNGSKGSKGKDVKTVVPGTWEAAVKRLFVKEYKVDAKANVEKEQTYALPTTKEDFSSTFLDETDPENPRVKNMDVFMRRVSGTVSYLKTVGEHLFPTVHPRRIERVPMNKYQFDMYSKMRHKERDMEKSQRRKHRGAPGGVLAKQGTVYRAFSRMACNFVFPDGIKRPFPQDLRQMAKKEMDAAAEDAEEEEEEGEKKPAVTDVARKYEQQITKAMNALEQSSDQYLTAEVLRKKYSPKMAHMLGDIEESPGKVLVYSQFRTVEGLGVMKLILEKAGYIEVVLENKGGEYAIKNEGVVMDPLYDGKRFITFSGDRDKTDALLDMFNAVNMTGVTKVSPALKEVLGRRAQLHGEFIKILMITQSGAEGISLKCVRRVLIMEPFWNMVRLEQVIGRAVRARSHMDLPERERDVTVSIYTSTFTSDMLKDFTIQTKDYGLTSDTHILQIANKKDEIIQTFLNHLKSIAVDCRNNAGVNKPTASGMKCYAFPVNDNPDDFAYHTYLSQDIAIDANARRLTKHRQIQGRAVAQRATGKKYVKVPEFPGKVFDYAAYKDAGVLVEM
jgi:superfamily II DNA or RNA helicase